MSQSSYVSSNDPRLHFGLGAAAVADIEVRWPMGSVDMHKDLPVDRLITLVEGSPNLTSEKLTPASKPAPRPATASRP
jgi:hypothetical protein